MNVAYFENLSITMMIVPHPLDCAIPNDSLCLSFPMVRFGVGNGSNNLAGF